MFPIVLPRTIALAAVTIALVEPAASKTVQLNQLYGHVPTVYNRYGAAVVGLGDIDGDRHDDYAVGGPTQWHVHPKAHVDVFSGQTGKHVYRLWGINNTGLFGHALASIHDVDGDGVRDLLIGAPGTDVAADKRAGMIYVVSAKQGAILARLYGPGAGAEFGWALAAIGDWNNDNVQDFAVGAPAHPNNSHWGEVRIYSGTGRPQLLARFTGRAADDRFGQVLCGIGDNDRNGYAEIAIGAPSRRGTAGFVRAYDGRFNATVFQIEGGAGKLAVGRALALTGDIDGDKGADLLIGTNDSGNNGGIDVVRAKNGSRIYSIGGGGWAEFGSALADLGDIDGDGTPDFAAASVAFPSSRFFGRVQIYSGKTASLLVTLDGSTPGARLGHGLANAGDVDNDGSPDLIIGTPGRLRRDKPDAQSARVYSLRIKPLTTDRHQIAIGPGGAVNYRLAVGSQHAGKNYIIGGSLTGYAPGLRIWGVHIPLVFDPYTLFSLGNPNSPMTAGSFGRLDANGVATMTFKIQPGLPSSAIGSTFWHAALVFDSLGARTFKVALASNARPTTLVGTVR